ncbi:MAG: RtcB family protein [Candidatus Dojkabacteria bacterium]
MASPLVTTFGSVDERALAQLMTCAQEADYAVLCADHHAGYSQPIGAAIAYEHFVSPSGVGYDIGCGNKAVRTNLQRKDIDIKKVMEEIAERINFGVGRKNKKPVHHPVLNLIEQAPFAPQRQLLKLAEEQLGTVGSGNHYVDIFEDDDGWIWAGVHFGSRGFGHKTASGFLSLAEGKDFERGQGNGEMDSPPVLLDVRTQLGQDYISAMEIAGEYAYAGRDIVVNEVLKILGAKKTFSVHNHHNFAWQEEHFGKTYWVVRKGCTPAFPGQQGFVGASMGGVSVILEGVESELSQKALYSTVHGAGRIMSRTQAAGKSRWKKGKKVHISGGKVNFDRVRIELKHQGVLIKGGAADEAPEVYKNLDEVLQSHEGTIKILHRLRPIGVAMAGAGEADPYKD